MQEQKLWFLVRDAARQKSDPKSQALYLWLTPQGEEIPTIKGGFPEGVPLRVVSEKLAEMGYCNGKGQQYHPYQLQEMIDDAAADAFAEVKGLTLTEEQRQALKSAFRDGRRQKRRYVAEADEEWEVRCSWRRMKRPVKRHRPWDGQDDHDDEDDSGSAGTSARRK